MRAVIHDRYGPPEVLRVGEVERPVPTEDEVLVRVFASSVTRGDAMGVRSVEYRFVRLLTGVRGGRRCSERRKADKADLRRGGGDPGRIAARLSMLRPLEPLHGKSVLVYGAAGSIGTSAVQLLAHHFDAAVSAACDTKDLELVQSLGAQHVLDRFADFTKNGKTYDVIFDAVGKHSFRRCRGSLNRGGVYVTTDLGFMYHVPLVALATRLAGRRRAKLGVGRYRKQDLLLVKELVDTGKYRPVIDRTYTLDEIVEATAYVESGEKSGSVVLRVGA